jgi:hypothetical protein
MGWTARYGWYRRSYDMNTQILASFSVFLEVKVKLFGN